MLLLDLATAQFSLGDTQAALDLLERGQFCALILVLVGSNTQIGYVMNRQANLCLLHRMFREAEWLFSMSAAFYQTALGKQHPFTIQLLKNQQVAQGWAHRPGEPHPCPCVSPWIASCYCPQEIPCPSSYFSQPIRGGES